MEKRCVPLLASGRNAKVLISDLESDLQKISVIETQLRQLKLIKQAPNNVSVAEIGMFGGRTPQTSQEVVAPTYAAAII